MKNLYSVCTIILVFLVGSFNDTFAQKPKSGQYELVGTYNPIGDLGSASVALTVADGGSGKYKAILTDDASLPTHSIYRPRNMDAFGDNHKLPIIVYGNGACLNSSQQLVVFLTEVASHGYVVIAPGSVKNVVFGMDPWKTSTSKDLLDAIDWAVSQTNSPKSPYYQKFNANKIAVMGMSCGGLQALEISNDSRISTSVILNSGVFSLGMPSLPKGVDMSEMIKRFSKDSSNSGTASKNNPMAGIAMSMPNVKASDLKKIHAPMIYLTGGKDDIATANAEDNLKYLENIPMFFASYDFSDVVNAPGHVKRQGEEFTGYGHYPATYKEPHAGDFAIAAVAWLNWQLKGDRKAGEMFKGNPCGLMKNPKWTVKKKNID